MARRNVAPTGSSTVAAILGAPPPGEVTLTGVSDDSRTVMPGDLFFCVRGTRFDPHHAAREILASGAAALVVDRDVDVPGGSVVIRVPDVRAIVGPVVSELLGRPSTKVPMVGVTGTNGKTSTAAFVAAALRGHGANPAVFGTLTAARTTPEPLELQSALADAVEGGATHVVMEVSSHALALGRVNGIVFDVAVFTNLSRDHIDFHGSMDEYRAAKFSLFSPSRARHAVVNADDPAGRDLLGACTVHAVASSSADLSDVVVGATSVSYVWSGVGVTVPVGGRFTVENSRLALETCRLLGVPPDAAARGLSAAPPVPGRMEPVQTDGGFDVIVDYAHTPDALRALLTTVRESAGGRVLLVFGCGGDRDKGKRPEMGRVAAELSDVMWVTSDNPRTEDPHAIIHDIIAGTSAARARVIVQSDRAAAIESAISEAGHGDIVVVAGKGHEPYQEIAGVFHEFSDVNVARAAAARRSGTR